MTITDHPQALRLADTGEGVPVEILAARPLYLHLTYDQIDELLDARDYERPVWLQAAEHLGAEPAWRRLDAATITNVIVTP